MALGFITRNLPVKYMLIVNSISILGVRQNSANTEGASDLAVELLLCYTIKDLFTKDKIGTVATVDTCFACKNSLTNS
jgi:hypothetical protein